MCKVEKDHSYSIVIINQNHPANCCFDCIALNTLGTHDIKKAGVIAFQYSGCALQNSKQISKWQLL